MALRAASRLEEGDAEADPDEPDYEISGESSGPGRRVDRGIILTRQISGVVGRHQYYICPDPASQAD
jgi:hypothetical protein